MAGDWIKMRVDLATSPKVVRIASALRADRLRVIGGLHAVWCLFDMHSTDGKLDGYTHEALDELVGFDGLARAMESVEWLAMDGESLVIPRFEDHNGKSAKRRATETERKRDARKTSACDADKMRTREEKRRVNPPTPIKGVSDTPAGFESFWLAYPRKVSKPQAEKAWRKLNPDTKTLQNILAGVARDGRSDQWLRDGGQFVPHPATWLNGRRWEDETGAPINGSSLLDNPLFAGMGR